MTVLPLHLNTKILMRTVMKENVTPKYDNKGLKVLNLIIKQRYFDAILSGHKVKEYREIRPQNERKYVLIDDEGYAVEDENGNCVPVKYDAIRFFVGYNKDRDTALVEVKDAYTEVFVDDKGNPIAYEYGKDENGEPIMYYAEQIVYNLGAILNYEIKKR